jgi:hypothetical protein
MDNYSHSQEVHHLKGEIKLGQNLNGQYCIATINQDNTFVDLWVDRDVLKRFCKHTLYVMEWQEKNNQ